MKRPWKQRAERRTMGVGDAGEPGAARRRGRQGGGGDPADPARRAAGGGPARGRAADGRLGERAGGRRRGRGPEAVGRAGDGGGPADPARRRRGRSGAAGARGAGPHRGGVRGHERPRRRLPVRSDRAPAHERGARRGGGDHHRDGVGPEGAEGGRRRGAGGGARVGADGRRAGVPGRGGVMEGENEPEVVPEDVPVEPADTDTDTEPEPEVPATPADKKVTLDELLADPRVLAHMDVLDDYPLTADDIADLDPKAQRLLAAVLKRAQADVPAFQQRQKEVDDRQRVLDARERMLTRQVEAAIKPFTDPRLRALADKRVADRFDKFLGRAVELDAEARQRAEEAERAQAVAEQRAVDEAYVAEHEESFADERVLDRVTVLVQNHNFTLQDAHRLAELELVNQNEADTRTKALEESRARVQRGGRSAPTLPDTPEDDEARAAFYAKYPEAVQRDFAKHYPEHARRQREQQARERKLGQP